MTPSEAKKVNTFGIKLSELRPCDNCGGRIAPIFHHVQIRHAIINPRNANSVLGMMLMCGWGQSGQSLAVAEAMAPGADNAAEVLSEPDATVTLYLCPKCVSEDVNLAVLMEKCHAISEP